MAGDVSSTENSKVVLREGRVIYRIAPGDARDSNMSSVACRSTGFPSKRVGQGDYEQGLRKRPLVDQNRPR